MVNSKGEESHLIRVLSVIAQNRNGAILKGQCITDSGEIVDTHQQIVARLHGRGLAVPVMPGQWWTVKGKVNTNSFINAGGFKMVEEQMEVLPGDAILKVPSGAHIVDYLKRNPRFTGVGPATADKLWETFKERLVEILDAGVYTALEEVVSHVKGKRTPIHIWRNRQLWVKQRHGNWCGSIRFCWCLPVMRQQCRQVFVQ